MTVDALAAEESARKIRPVPRARKITGYRYLVEQRLSELSGEPVNVCQWVAGRRTAGKTWQEIEDEINQTLGYPEDIRLSRQLLHKWCPKLLDG